MDRGNFLTLVIINKGQVSTTPNHTHMKDDSHNDTRAVGEAEQVQPSGRWSNIQLGLYNCWNTDTEWQTTTIIEHPTDH